MSITYDLISQEVIQTSTTTKTPSKNGQMDIETVVSKMLEIEDKPSVIIDQFDVDQIFDRTTNKLTAKMKKDGFNLYGL